MKEELEALRAEHRELVLEYQAGESPELFRKIENVERRMHFLENRIVRNALEEIRNNGG